MINQYKTTVASFFDSIKMSPTNTLYVLFTAISAYVLYVYPIDKTLNIFLVFLPIALLLLNKIEYSIGTFILTSSFFDVYPMFHAITFNIPIWLQVWDMYLLLLQLIIFLKSRGLMSRPRYDRQLYYFYTLILVFYTALGFIKGGSYRASIPEEVSLFSLWFIPIVLPHFFSVRSIKILKYFIFTTVVYVIGIYLYAKITGNYNMESRIITRHIFIVTPLIPYFFVSLFILRRRKTIIPAILFALSFWVIIVSQARTNLMTLAVALPAAYILCQKKVSIRNIVYIIPTLLITSVITYFFLKNDPDAMRRLSAITQFYTSTSFLLRVIVAVETVQHYGTSLLTGLGIGHIFPVTPLLSPTPIYHLDISYLTILGKMGILGLGFFLYINIRSFMIAVKTFKEKTYVDDTHKIITITLLVTIPMMLALGLLMPMFTKLLKMMVYYIMLALPYIYNKKYKQLHPDSI